MAPPLHPTANDSAPGVEVMPIQNIELRKRIRAGLNKGEARDNRFLILPLNVLFFTNGGVTPLFAKAQGLRSPVRRKTAVGSNRLFSEGWPPCRPKFDLIPLTVRLCRERSQLTMFLRAAGFSVFLQHHVLV
jgi:hypothetical protein